MGNNWSSFEPTVNTINEVTKTDDKKKRNKRSKTSKKISMDPEKYIDGVSANIDQETHSIKQVEHITKYPAASLVTVDDACHIPLVGSIAQKNTGKRRRTVKFRE